MNKKQQPSKAQPKARSIRKPAQELTEEQLKHITGGLNPQPLPPGKAPDDLHQ